MNRIQALNYLRSSGFSEEQINTICEALAPTDGDTISRQDAIDAIRASASKYTGFMEMEMYTDDDAVEAIEGVPSAEPKINRINLVRAITSGIIATNGNDIYSCGMRNGMRWCKSLLSDKEPKYEDASQYAEPEIIRCKDCKYFHDYYGNTSCINGRAMFDVKDDSYCSYAERRKDDM